MWEKNKQLLILSKFRSGFLDDFLENWIIMVKRDECQNCASAYIYSLSHTQCEEIIHRKWWRSVPIAVLPTSSGLHAAAAQELRNERHPDQRRAGGACRKVWDGTCGDLAMQEVLHLWGGTMCSAHPQLTSQAAP